MQELTSHYFTYLHKFKLIEWLTNVVHYKNKMYRVIQTDCG